MKCRKFYIFNFKKWFSIGKIFGLKLWMAFFVLVLLGFNIWYLIQVNPYQSFEGVWFLFISGQSLDPTDDSLTNIHWLQSLSSPDFVPSSSPLIPGSSDISSSQSQAMSPGSMVINGNHIIIQSRENHNAADVSSVVDSDKHIKKVCRAFLR